MEKIRIWCGGEAPLPTVYIHSVAGDGHNVWESCRRIGCPDFNLVSVYDFDFENEMTPWAAPAVRKGQPPFKGNAESRLAGLLGRIMPDVETRLPKPPLYNALAGYSLAGLFALWSVWKADRFTRIACGSASFWYPGFIEYAISHPMIRRPDFVSLSLGDNESNTKHPVMSRVGICTERILGLLTERDIPHCFEINPGNHFTEPDLRLAKAISRMLDGQDSINDRQRGR